MSKEKIAKFENEIKKVIIVFEHDHEITTAEICGVLGVIKTEKEVRAILPFCTDLLKDLLGVPAESKGGAPVGEIITLERKEGDSMEK